MKNLRPLSFAELQSRVAAAERHAGATIVRTDAEAGARASIDRLRDVPMTDAEWSAARANLLAFVCLVSEWSSDDKRA